MLLDPNAKAALIERVLPLRHRGDPQPARGARARRAWARGPSAEELARAIQALGPEAVIVTGGHAEDGADVLFDGVRHAARSTALGTPDGASHGSGCTHSSALAAFLARGAELAEAARWAREIAAEAVGNGLRGLGAGPGPVDVFGLAQARRRPDGRWHNPMAMKLVRMKPGHGDVLLAEGDPEVAEDEERLIEEFRRQLDLGMWAAVPTAEGDAARGDHGARLLRDPAGRRARRVLPAGRRRLTRLPRDLARRARRPSRSSASGRRWPSGPAASAPEAAARAGAASPAYDPGRERRAEARARELLRSVVERGRVRDVRGARLHRGERARAGTAVMDTCSTRTGRSSPTTPRTGELLSEYCVGVPGSLGARAGRSGSPTRTTCSPSGCRCAPASES